MTDSLRALAFYLPQYHPTPENDAWWGVGFTEWRNVVQAQPLFAGHYQPHLAGELGYYDLRAAETRARQAELAHSHGIAGFCYYHYWFGGKRLLSRPLDAVLASGEPNFPFLLCWANEAWTRSWDGRSGVTLIEQIHSAQDDCAHFEWLAPVLCDPRYVRVDGKPLFLVYRAQQLADAQATTERWRERAHQLGVGEVFLARVESFTDEHDDPALHGFDAAVEFQPDWALLQDPLRRSRHWRWSSRARLSPRAFQTERIYDYTALARAALLKPAPPYLRFPCVTPMWDNTARRKQERVILINSSPAAYEEWLTAVVERVRQRAPSQQLVFINAWNEWAEGNHLEPDERHGVAYLQATRRAIQGAPA